MNKTHDREDIYRNKDKFEDETELIDYLRVMWRWK